MYFCIYFRYDMKGYDKNYEPYLESFGIPSIIVSLILGTTERLVITQSSDKKTIKTKTILSKNIFR